MFNRCTRFYVECWQSLASNSRLSTPHDNRAGHSEQRVHCVLSETGAPSSNELLAYYRVAGPCPRPSLRSASPPPGPRDVVILICHTEFTKSKLSLDPLDIHCLAPAGALVRPVRLQAPLASWRMEHPPSRRPWRIRLVGPSLAPLRAKPPPATGPDPVVHG